MNFKKIVKQNNQEDVTKETEDEEIHLETIKSPSKINIERGLISKLLETGDMTLFKDKQIKPSFFRGENAKIIRYLDEYYMTNGCLPTARVFSSKYPKFKLESYENAEGRTIVGTDEPLTYWCNELRMKVIHNTVCEELEEVFPLLDSFQTTKATDKIKKMILHLESELVESSSIDITSDKDARKLAYEERKRNKGMIGIPMGIDRLDTILKGMQPKQLITLIAKTGLGKANPLSTPILTPNGFIPMRDVKVGTKVIGQDGRPYPVVAIHPQGSKDVYELTFSDGTTSRCCKEHLWKFKTTDDRVRNKDWRVDTLENIMKLPLKRGKSYNLVIPVNDPVEFAEQETKLPLDPYVLGVLLGDGGFTTDRISLSNPEEDIMGYCNSILSEWGYFKYHKGTTCQYEFKKHDNLKENRLYREIKRLGLQGKNSKDKFIPKQYLHSSVEERRKLLMGLFDTDGHVNSKGGYSISTFSKQLKEDILYLCRSLGYRCLVSLYSDEYRIVISTNDVIFSSIKHRERYIHRQIPKKKHDYKVLKIVDIKKVGHEECQCISVDSQDHTYLCDNFIVTHNTWFFILLAAYCQLHGYSVLFFTTEMSEEQIEDRLEAMLMGMLYDEFNYSKFKSGTLDKEQEELYFEFLDRKEKFEPLIVESASGCGVSYVNAKIQQRKPDIVFIDGVYLMEDDRGSDQDWLRVTHITRDVKQVAKSTKIPILINSQADRTTSTKTGPELENIGFSSAIGHDSDVVLALFRDEEMLEDREMKVKILKQREGITGSVMLNWDFSTMNFSPIYSDVSDSEVKSGESNYVQL